jgi:hypothetical protein
LPLQLLQQENLMNGVASQTVRRGDHHQVEASEIPSFLEADPE